MPLGVSGRVQAIENTAGTNSKALRTCSIGRNRSGPTNKLDHSGLPEVEIGGINPTKGNNILD
jgi:hypothetical protein